MHVSSRAAAIVIAAMISLPAGAQPSEGTTADKVDGEADLRALNAAPKPTPQNDLSPETIASAHRERASNEDERTSGLFQSWLVSICQGCGVIRQPPYARVKALFGEATVPARPRTAEREPAPAPARKVVVKVSRDDADLLPEGLGGIRQRTRP